MDFRKIALGVLTSIAWLLAHVPGNVQHLSLTTIFLMIADLTFGWIVLARNGKLDSKEMRGSLLSKFTIFGAIMVVTGIVAFQFETWSWSLAGMGGICMVEMTSLVQSVTVMIRQEQQRGAKGWEPILALLARIEPIFATSARFPSTALPEKTDSTTTATSANVPATE